MTKEYTHRLTVSNVVVEDKLRRRLDVKSTLGPPILIPCGIRDLRNTSVDAEEKTQRNCIGDRTKLKKR